MTKEKITDEHRDAFRRFRYFTGQKASHLEGVTAQEISLIEKDYSISTEKFLQVIQRAWGMESLEDLLFKAKDLPERPFEEITQEHRDAFRRFRYFTGQKASHLKGVTQQKINCIEKDYSISTEKFLQIIKTAWGMESLEDLLFKAKDLPERPFEEITQEHRDAFRAIRYNKNQTLEQIAIIGQVTRQYISRIENFERINADRFLEITEKAWGITSLDELLKAAEGLEVPPRRRPGCER